MSIESLPEFTLSDHGPTSAECLRAGLTSFREAAAHVWRLPYGRVTAAGGWSAVLRERRGTCSSKHALLATLVIEHGRADVDLVLGIYEMHEANTPGVGPVLAAHGLASVPEAHCYLRHAGQRVDLTRSDAPAGLPFVTALLHEETVHPAELSAYKPRRHRALLQGWARERGLDAEHLWAAREACIAALEGRAA